VKKRTAVRAEQPVAQLDERSGKSEFSPDVMRRFAALAEAMKVRHGLSDEALGERIGWSEFGISRLRKNNRGITAAPALGLTQLAEIDYESFVIHGVHVMRGPSFDVRNLPSFRVAQSLILESHTHAPAIVEIAADLLSVARPRSVTLAMLDHACSLVGLVNSAPAELRGSGLVFAHSHENDRIEADPATSKRGKNEASDDDGGSAGGVRRLGHRAGAEGRNNQ
jgi:hypothetical protein